MNTQQLEMIAATLICLVGSGCQAMRDHPRTTAFIAGSLVLTAGGALRASSHDGPTHSFAPAICSTQPSACR